MTKQAKAEKPEVKCPYCGALAKLVTGRATYPHRTDLYELFFWECRPCDAYTGCHKNSRRHAPKGSLANAELREARKKAHAAFDPLWKDGGIFAGERGKAYRWLSDTLGLDRKVHIGFSDLNQCRRIIELCDGLMDDDGDPDDWMEYSDIDAARDVFECIADDLPDGAYFAMAQEFGLEPEDLIDDEQS